MERLKLKSDKPLSIIAFNFNLRRYSVRFDAAALAEHCGAGAGRDQQEAFYFRIFHK